MTFPPRSAIILETSRSCPGLSINSILIESERPDLRSPLFITFESIVTSIFPPDTRHITFFPLTGTLLNIAAATDTAPAPSEISLCCSIRASIAEEISSSLTVTISSTYFLQNSNVCSPGSLTLIPSAIVATSSRHSILPF